MLAPKTNSEPRNLNFSLQKSQQTARFELNSTEVLEIYDQPSVVLFILLAVTIIYFCFSLISIK